MRRVQVILDTYEQSILVYCPEEQRRLRLSLAPFGKSNDPAAWYILYCRTNDVSLVFGYLRSAPAD